MGIFFDHGVEDDQEFAHAGSGDDFGEIGLMVGRTFATGECCRELSDDVVEAFGREGGRVEGRSNVGSPPAMWRVLLALPLSSLYGATQTNVAIC